MGSRRHFAEEVQQVLVQQGIFGQERAEMAQLFLIREFTVNQEPCGLRERRLFSEILDGITAIAQNSLFAIDVCDGTLGTTGIEVTVVQRDQSSILAEFAYIKTMFVFSTSYNGKFVLLSVVIQYCCIGHKSSVLRGIAAVRLSSLQRNYRYFQRACRAFRSGQR